MFDFKEFLIDVLLIIKLFFLSIYWYLEVLFKNFSTFEKDISGEIVLVTGAAGGIGKNLVKKLYDLGCVVICIDNNNTALVQLKDELLNVYANTEHNNNTILPRAHFYCVDITNPDEVKNLGNRIRTDVGNVDILVNNAGIMNKGKLLVELENQEILNVFNVNVLSHFWLCKEFLPSMINKNKGHIVNVSSVCGLMGGYKLTDYCSTKFAVYGFTESLRVELKVTNPNNKIQVSVVCPFHVKTKLFNGVEFSRLKWLTLSMEPEYVAEKIVDGILKNRELIYIPSGVVTVFQAIRNLVTTKFIDCAQQTFDLNGSMDRYKPVKSSGLKSD